MILGIVFEKVVFLKTSNNFLRPNSPSCLEFIRRNMGHRLFSLSKTLKILGIKQLETVLKKKRKKKECNLLSLQ